MPDIPDAGDVTDEGQGALADGVVYAIGTGVGQSALGGIGHAAGGVVAGASIGGQKGATLSTLAVAEGVKASLLSGGGGNQRRVK